MKTLFSEYADALFVALVSMLSVTIFISIIFTDLIGVNLELVDMSLKPIYIESEVIPVTISVFEGKDMLVNLDEELDYSDRIEAFNSNGEDISDYVTVVGFDSSSVGEKEILYQLNYNGESRVIKAKLRVVNEREEVSA